MKYQIIRKALDGIVLGALASAMLSGAARAGTLGGKEEIPREYIQYCRDAGAVYQICPELLEAVIEVESEGSPDAVGEAGEIGLMQIHPKYHRARAERLGVHCVQDPRGNIFIGADYLAELFLEYGDTGTALMAYNGAEDAEERGKRGDYTDYAVKVMERSRQLERMHDK